MYNEEYVQLMKKQLESKSRQLETSQDDFYIMEQQVKACRLEIQQKNLHIEMLAKIIADLASNS